VCYPDATVPRRGAAAGHQVRGRHLIENGSRDEEDGDSEHASDSEHVNRRSPSPVQAAPVNSPTPPLPQSPSEERSDEEQRMTLAIFRSGRDNELLFTVELDYNCSWQQALSTIAARLATDIRYAYLYTRTDSEDPISRVQRSAPPLHSTSAARVPSASSGAATSRDHARCVHQTPSKTRLPLCCAWNVLATPALSTPR
jgi:hypothetical protein